MSDIRPAKDKKKETRSFGSKLLTLLLLPLRIFLYYFVIQIMLRIWFKLFHRMRFSRAGFTLPKGNFIVLGNHATNWDGIYINCYLRRFVYFIVNDEVFKYAFSRVLAINVLGQVQRGKTKNDISFLRRLTELKKEHRHIGIFPEGDTGMTGTLAPIEPGIAKLCRMLKLPIVTVRLEGGSFQRPRWSYFARRFPLNLTVTDVISAEAAADAGNDGLYARLVKGITYDDNAYQQRTGFLLNKCCRRRAERLENALFVCPSCGGLHTLFARREHFSCKQCGYTVTYTRENRLLALPGNVPCPQTVAAWDAWQKTQLPALLDAARAQGRPLLTLSNWSYNRTGEYEFLYRPQSRGTLTVTPDALVYTADDGTHTETFPAAEIMHLQLKFVGAPEFIFRGGRYRFKSKDKKDYGYMLSCLIAAMNAGAHGQTDAAIR